MVSTPQLGLIDFHSIPARDDTLFLKNCDDFVFVLIFDTKVCDTNILPEFW